MSLLVATRNRGKIAELARLLDGLSVSLVGLDAYPDIPEVVEDADTFHGNATKKARELALATGLPTLADDSGLEVVALDGAPGVYSARYAGEHGNDAANNQKLLDALQDQTERKAQFRCVLAFVDPKGLLGDRVELHEGIVEGHILEAPRGDGGFGYDPLFVRSGETRTMAELSADEKNAESHRSRAVREMLPFLQRYFAD